MKPPSSFTVFLFSSSRRRLFTRTTLTSQPHTLVGISHFSTSSPDPSASASSSYHSSPRRNSDDVRNVRVSVWWDFENCQIPCNINVYKVTQCITAAVRSVGIKGPIQITAFGDVLQLSRSNQEALSSTGINLNHIPNGGKNSADRSLLVDLMYWVSQNPPPAHLFLISADRDFASILHRLRMSNYNILLASTDNAPAVLCGAASIMWQWTSLVKGENLSAKHFNQPPDGPNASWYGHYRVPLEDPYVVCNHQTSNGQSEEASDPNSEVKLRPVPKAVLNVIRGILNSYPKGLSITELRAELGKSNVNIDRDLYGHKKFSRFLSAMPQLLKLQFEKDGQFIVHGVSAKSAAPSTVNAKESVPTVASKEDSVVTHKTSEPPNEEISSSSSKVNVPKVSPDQPLPEKQEEPNKVQEQTPIIKESKEAESRRDHFYPVKMKKPTPQVGIFKSLWRKWFKGNDDYQKKIGYTINEPSNSQNRPVKVKSVDSKDQSSDTKKVPSSSLSTNEATQDAAIGQKSAENADKLSVFNKIVRWCKFWKSEETSDNQDAELSKSDKEISNHSEMQKVFTESFWNDLLTFLKSSDGSASVLLSKTRQEMAQNLQRLGSSQLQSLSESQILNLVDSLISEKKWVAETPTQLFPFKLVGPSRSTSSSKPSTSNDPTKQNKESTESNTKTQGLERFITKKVTPKNRSQILSDCQKLVNEVVKTHPEGFQISCFKKVFFEKYRYPLEVQQLGYQKLSTLLQIMPGVKLESNNILPSGDHSRVPRSETVGTIIDECYNPKSDLTKTEDDNDTQWEELGPIAEVNEKVNHEFEEVSDNDLSDSEEESSPLQNQATHGTQGDSSLLQILDSWYSNTEHNNSGTVSEVTDSNIDNSNNSKKTSFSSEVDPAWNSFDQKQKPLKRYSFVTDKPRDDKEKVLIDGILGSLKKPGNGTTQSKIEG